ncbi:MAG: hypothetical protein ACRDJL_11260, partial [Actinomycetota bacterium]
MESLILIISWLDAVVFGALAVVSFRRWRRDGGSAVGWLAATFAVLAFVVIFGVFSPDESDATVMQVLSRLVIATLVLFPYFLFRFMTALRPVGRAVEVLAGGLTTACVLASAFLPVAAEEEAPEGFFVFFIALVLIQWTVLSTFVAGRLWRMGSDQPSIVRRRMRLLSLGSAALNLGLILAGLTSGVESSGLSLVIQLLAVSSALLFFAGFAPPGFLRILWRREEQEELR